MARNTARASELALRKAIGAGQLRLVRQLLTENRPDCGAGGAAGVAFGYWGLRLLIAIAPRDIPRLAETTLDLPVLLFACGITLTAGLLAGLAPVLVAGKIDLTTALKEGARLSGGGKQRQSFRNILVVAEVALTFVLAFGSGLLLRSLAAAQTTSPGFDPQHVLSFSLQLPRRRLTSNSRRSAPSMIACSPICALCPALSMPAPFTAHHQRAIAAIGSIPFPDARSHHGMTCRSLFSIAPTPGTSG